VAEVVKLVPEVEELEVVPLVHLMVEIHQVMELLIQEAEAEVEVDLAVEVERGRVLEL
jgi:hypothetical protein